jgi:hypothetical protein
MGEKLKTSLIRRIIQFQYNLRNPIIKLNKLEGKVKP